MHREPTPKSQANIVRRVFADHGVTLAHRQALDVVAQVHGHTSWQVMQAQLPKATPVKSESKPAKAAAKSASKPVYPAPSTPILAPAMPAADVADETDTNEQFIYSFDGIAFLDTRDEFESLCDDEVRAARLWDEMKVELTAMGFTALEGVSVSEDDEQDDDDIKVFVCVKLVGRSSCEENERPPYELEALLERLAVAACCDESGNQLAHPNDWELLSIDEE